MLECSACGKDNKGTNKFCIYCGMKMRVIKEQISEYSKVFKSPDGLLVALLSKVAKSDGNIVQEEANFMGKIYDKLSQSNSHPNLRKFFKEILANEKDKLDNVEELCLALLGFNITNRYKLDMISMLVELAYIDGRYSPKEEKLIVKIVHYLQVDYEEYKKIVALYTPKEEKEQEKQSTSSSGYLTIDECYTELKTSKDADNLTLKKNYRKLAKEYHSDILQGKNLPEDLIAFADEKFKAVNFAYEKLKKYRNF